MTTRRLTLLCFILFLSLAGCGEYQQKERQPSADWSRSLQLGQNLTGSPGLWVEGAGERLHLAWPHEEDDRYFLHYEQRDAQAKPLTQWDTAVNGILKAPRLLPAASGGYHLIWASRPPGGSVWTLWQQRLTPTGDQAGDRIMISPSDLNVGKYALAAEPDGRIVLAAEDADSGSLLVARIHEDGRVSPWQSITENGENPALQVDAAGRLHLAWFYDKRIYYTPLAAEQPITAVPIADLRGLLNESGDLFGGPSLGVADGWVYAMWSVLSGTDTEAGHARTQYVAFPVDNPTAVSQPQFVNLLTLAEQPSFAYQGPLGLTQLSPSLTFQEAVGKYGMEIPGQSKLHGDWVDVAAVSDFIMNPSAANSAPQTLVVALATSQDYQLDTKVQIAAALFADGRYQGYSIASHTRRVSDDPLPVVDAAGNIHLLWREGARGKDLYYATTAPTAKAALNRITTGDFFNIGLEMGIESLVSIAMLPIISVWGILAGLVLLFIWTRWRGLSTRLPFWLPIGAAFLLYYALKLVFLPGITTYVPFSAWIYIPPGYDTGLRTIVPLLIVGMALLITRRTYERQAQSTIRPYLSLTLTDAVLTLAIYGVTLFGAL